MDFRSLKIHFFGGPGKRDSLCLSLCVVFLPSGTVQVVL